MLLFADVFLAAAVVVATVTFVVVGLCFSATSDALVTAVIFRCYILCCYFCKQSLDYVAAAADSITTVPSAIASSVVAAADVVVVCCFSQ